MHPRNLVFITLLALCHLQLRGQALPTGLPPDHHQQAIAGQAASPPSEPSSSVAQPAQIPSSSLPPDPLPDDPDQQLIPEAKQEPSHPGGVPVLARADSQTWEGNIWTGAGSVEFHYRDYVLHADKVVYDRSTSEVQAEGHVQVAGGPNDVLINADRGDMRLDLHTGRFYQVNGSQGVRTAGRTTVYSTANPFLF